MSTTRPSPLGVSVTESASARYSDSELGPNVDAGVQGGSSIHVDEQGDPMLGHHGATEILPELRSLVRSAEDVEREREGSRPKRSPWMLPLAVGLGVFVLILAASPLVVWMALSQQADPVKASPPPQEDLMGIPVRRGLNSAPPSY